MRKSEQKIINAGYLFNSYEYDGAAQRKMRELTNKGFWVELLRERSDTKGMKMYSVWVKGDKAALEAAGVSAFLPL